MKRIQAGFTMIELIVVIVILGILAATALPKFIDLRGDAVQSATDGMAGQLASAMSINYAGCQATGNVVTANKCIAVDNCDDAASLLSGGAFPSNGSTTFAVTAGAIGNGTTNGATASCTLTGTNGTTVKTQTFQGVSAGL